MGLMEKSGYKSHSTKEEIQKYFDTDAISQSTLKKLLAGMDKYVRKETSETDQKETEAMLIGSVVDCVLLHEEGDFDKTYYISDREIDLSDIEKTMVQSVYEKAKTAPPGKRNMEEYANEIGETVCQFNWQPNWKPETRINKLTEKGREYFRELFATEGKKIITRDVMNKVDKVVESLTTHPRTKNYFVRDASPSSNIEVYKQKPLYFLMDGKECKALLDIMIIDTSDEKKINVYIFDLKTMSEPVSYFPSSVKRFRYDIQAAWYLKAVEEVIEKPFKKLGGREDIVFSYAFINIVESVNYPGNPALYQYSSNLIKLGRFGGDGEKGYEKLFKEFMFYELTGWKEDLFTAKGDIIMLEP